MKATSTFLYLSFISELAISQGTWISRGTIGGAARQSPVGFTIGRYGYVCAGSSFNDLWQYDPSINTWTQKASLPGQGRSNAAGFSIGNYGYIGTGQGSS